MKNTIKIYNGPTVAFNKLLNEKEKFISLHTLTTSIDKLNFNLWMEDNEGKNELFVCYNEEYASVNEHVLGLLPNLIKLLFQKGCVVDCFFQNPPQILKEGLIREFGNSDTYNFSIVNHSFKSITEDEIANVYEMYHDEIVGQDSAITEILSTILPLTTRRYEKPIVMMFYGSPGVGKTETASFLNRTLFGGKLFRQQLAMFKTEDFGSYLFGGKINNSSFARDLIGRESNVILLDEFDKCPATFHSAFYQMFDEGVFVDKNYEVNLTGTIIICTTNYKSQKEIMENLGGPIYSRFDHFVPFYELTLEDKEKLIRISYEKLLDLWSEEQKEILLEENALKYLISRAEKFSNARNIKNGIRAYMSSILLHHILRQNRE